MIYDFIVIGSGFGGSVFALLLAEKAYSVMSRISVKDGSEVLEISKLLLVLEKEWIRK